MKFSVVASSALALAALPLLFDMYCEDPAGAPKLFCWLAAAGLACLRAEVPRSGAWLALAAWWLWALISAVYNGHSTAWLQLLIVGAGLVWICGPQRPWPWLALGWGLSITYSWMQRLRMDPFEWSMPDLSVAKTIAGLGNPNYLAMYLAALFPLMWHHLYRRGWPGWLAAVVSLTGFFLIGTRGSILALSLVLGLSTLASGLKDRRFWLVTWTLFGLTWAVSMKASSYSRWSFQQSMSRMTKGRTDLSVNARSLMWNSAWRQAVQHPVTGVGLGHFGDGYLLNRELEPELFRFRTRRPEDPHNEPLRVLCETGVPGLLLWSTWILLALRWRLAGLVEAWKKKFLREAQPPPENASKPIGSEAAEPKPPENHHPFSVETACLLVLLANGMTNCYPLALWPLLLLWTIPPAHGYAPTRRLGLLPLLLCLTLGIAGWAAQRAFWWDDDDRLDPNRIHSTERLRRLLYLQAYCPPWYAENLAIRLNQAWLTRARLSGDSADWQRAVYWARERTLRNPANAYAWHSLFGTLEARGDAQGALAAARQASARDPLNPGFHYFLARAYYQAGNREEAVRSLDRSIEIYSKVAQVYQFRSQIMIELGKTWEGYWDWVRSQQIEQGE